MQREARAIGEMAVQVRERKRRRRNGIWMSTGERAHKHVERGPSVINAYGRWT